MGRFNEIYAQMPNPLDDDALIKRLIEVYGNHDSLIEAITKYHASQKKNHHGEYYQHLKDNLYAQLYQIWKSNILSLTDKEIDELIKSNPNISQDFHLLKEYIRNIDIKTVEEYKEIIKNPSNLIAKYGWHNMGRFTGWCHINSSMLNLGKEPMMKYKHKLALNIESTDLDYIASLFVSKCLSRNLPFYIKLDEYGKRDDALIINSDTEHLQDYIDILEELKRENEDLFGHIHQPPVLMGSIDNWIGYASEDSFSPDGLRIPFENERVETIEKGIVSSIKEWVLQNQNALISYKGQDISFKEYLVTNITDAIMRENETTIKELISHNRFGYFNNYSPYLSSVQSLHDKIYNSLLTQIDEIILNYCQSKGVSPVNIPLGEDQNITINNSYFYQAFDQLSIQIVQSSPSFIQTVRQHIMDEAYKLGIDTDKYCFNVSAREELFNYRKPQALEEGRDLSREALLEENKALKTRIAQLEQELKQLSKSQTAEELEQKNEELLKRIDELESNIQKMAHRNSLAPTSESIPQDYELGDEPQVEQPTEQSVEQPIEQATEPTSSLATTSPSQEVIPSEPEKKEETPSELENKAVHKQESVSQSFIDWVYHNLSSPVTHHNESINLDEYLSILITDNLIDRYKDTISSLQEVKQLKDIKDFKIITHEYKRDVLVLQFIYGIIQTKIQKIMTALHNKTALPDVKIKLSSNLYLDVTEEDITKSLCELVNNIKDISPLYNESTLSENESLQAAESSSTLPAKIDIETVLASLKPDLLEKQVLLPDGQEISAKTYIQKYVLPYIPDDGYFTLKNNTRIPYKDFIEYYILTLGQTIYQGDIAKLLKDTTKMEESVTMNLNNGSLTIYPYNISSASLQDSQTVESRKGLA